VYVRSASLFFGTQQANDSYRWFEVAFYHHPLGGNSSNEPYALPSIHEVHDALTTMGIRRTQIADGPSPIDGEDEESFHERWIGLIALGLTGKLSRPNRLPVEETGPWNILLREDQSIASLSGIPSKPF
jgi:hypothetical protein